MMNFPIVEVMIKAGTLVDSPQFARDSGMTSEALLSQVAERRLFALEFAGRAYYPRFFLDSRYDRRQLETVCADLAALGAGSKLQFFTTGKASLSGRTPLEALEQGAFDRVRTAAQGFADQ